MSKKRFPVKACVDRVRDCFDDPPMPKPRGPDPRLAHRAPVPDPPQRAEVAPASGVQLSPKFAHRGGIRHPPPPMPAERPAHLSKSDWFRLSAPLPSALHDACARGTA